MPGVTLPQDQTTTIARLIARVERLERFIQNLSAPHSAELWNYDGATLRPTTTPDNLLASGNLLVMLSSALAVEINAVSTVNIVGPSGVNITSQSFTDISLAGQVKINNYVQLDEVAGIGAADANSGRVYMQDNGGGKTQFVARFPTGAVQIIATEP